MRKIKRTRRTVKGLYNRKKRSNKRTYTTSGTRF